ncbi:MAG: family lipolytic protein [Chitinophagaceae bacterium]|nr:family lipolytic protein [Chitinophagaceae bacterium]
MKLLTRLFFIVSFLSAVSQLKAQQEAPPFWNEILDFKKQDSIQPPPQNAILFVGSSSFNNWKDVQDYFPGYPIINRGFGGSSLPDVIRYAGDIIFPYHPRQVVIYCGENDLAASDSVTAQTVFERFRILFAMIRDKYKKIPIVYVSIKPSPSRQKLMPKMVAANELIKAFLKKKKQTSFVDVYHKMLTQDGQPIDNIFMEDKLHMNKSGYVIWQKEIEPYLLK